MTADRRILIVAHSSAGKFSPFVEEQAQGLASAGFEVRMFGVQGGGAVGYLRQLPKLKRAISEFRPDIVHAHYGLSGLLASLQRKAPVVTTYHGSDVHSGGTLLKLSRICMRRSKFNIFVSDALLSLSGYKKDNAAVIPCGVDMNQFFPMDRKQTRQMLSELPEEAGLTMEPGTKYVLFAGAFDNPVKNAPLAEEAVSLLNRMIASESPAQKTESVILLELRGYSRYQVNLLLNAVDCLLMTSLREGSPMVIKEAMATGCPIVSVDAGDVARRTEGIDGCYITERNPESVARALRQALQFAGKTAGRERLEATRLSQAAVIERIAEVYDKVLSSRK